MQPTMAIWEGQICCHPVARYTYTVVITAYPYVLLFVYSHRYPYCNHYRYRFTIAGPDVVHKVPRPYTNAGLPLVNRFAAHVPFIFF